MGAESTGRGHTLRPQQLCEHLLEDFPDAPDLDTLDLLAPVRRAMLKLEEAGLVFPIWHQRSPVWQITELGQAVLVDGTIEQRLRKSG